MPQDGGRICLQSAGLSSKQLNALCNRKTTNEMWVSVGQLRIASIDTAAPPPPRTDTSGNLMQTETYFGKLLPVYTLLKLYFMGELVSLALKPSTHHQPQGKATFP